MKLIFAMALLGFMVSCQGRPEPRKPIQSKSGSFYKESAERNKQLLEEEERKIQEIIENDTKNSYQASSNGSWYYYYKKNVSAVNTAKTDDLVTFTYAVLSLNNDTIYSMEDIGILKYKVDKQALFPGLRNSVKLLKEDETAAFLFPSSLGYGYHGDNNKIGINVPLKTILHIIKIDNPKEENLN